MKVRIMGITEILRRIWQFSAKNTKNSESSSKKPTQLIIAVWLQRIIAIIDTVFLPPSSTVLKKEFVVTLLANYEKSFEQFNMFELAFSLQGAGHNDVELYNQYLERLRHFVSQELTNWHKAPAAGAETDTNSSSELLLGHH